MRIGIDARMYGPGFTGIGRYTYELIRCLGQLDKNHEYWIFLRRESFDDFIPPNPRFHKVLADFPHYSFGEQIGFLRLLNQHHLDLMHFTHFNGPVFYRRPFIVTIHDLTLSFYPGKKMNRFFHRWAYHWVIKRMTRRAERIIAVSEKTKQDLIRVLHLPPEKIEVIYHGISSSFTEGKTIEIQKKLSLKRPYFLYTGVWRDHKNVVGLIRAFGLLLKKKGPSYDLVITGRPNPLYSEIPQTVKGLNLEAHVRFAGLVPEEELPSLYKGALAYVFPSFYEGFGFPPLEAMQCGVPVAASRSSSIPEICGEGNALYFDPSDLEDMARKMELISSDSSLRETLIQRGLTHVKQFDWKKSIQKTLEVYEKIGKLPKI